MLKSGKHGRAKVLTIEHEGLEGDGKDLITDTEKFKSKPQEKRKRVNE